MRVIHTVTAKKLKSLRKAGVLKVNTPFFQDNDDEQSYGKPREEFKNAPNIKYLCVIPKFRVQSWIKSGFMGEIEFFIKPEYVLEFDIPKNCFKFVREHSYTSPVETKKQFGLDQFMNVPEPYLTKIWNKYLKSNKVFNDFGDLKGINVPELWISANIPMKEIKVSKFSTLKRKYKF